MLRGFYLVVLGAYTARAATLKVDVQRSNEVATIRAQDALEFGGESSFCWKDSYGRGVGKVPTRCRNGQEMIGLFCYPVCPEGYKRFGFDCHQECPKGSTWRNHGLFCRHAEYPRGAGVSPLTQKNSGCPANKKEHVGLCYPECRAGYSRQLDRCWQNCNGFGRDDGHYCFKPATSYGRGAGLSPLKLPHKGCNPGESNVAGLCYGATPAGYKRIATYLYKNCNGFGRDDGLYCFKPAPYGRGSGRSPCTGCTGCSWGGCSGCSDCSTSRCHGHEEGWGALCYPKCRAGYHAVGCCICSPSCPSGFQDIGVSCKKPAIESPGKIPQNCGPNYQRNGLLCYPKCRAGFHPVGCCICSPDCPGGMADHGAMCRKNSYTTGVGTIPLSCDPGREIWGLLCHKKCRDGFRPFGCCLCRPPQPNCGALGMLPGGDLECAKRIIIGVPHIGICDEGMEMNVGLCYKFCRGGYHGVGPVCWGHAPKVGGTQWVNCAMGAADSDATCGMVIADQVSSVFMAILNIATLGAGNAATKTSMIVKKVTEVAEVVIPCATSVADAGISIADAVKKNESDDVGGTVLSAIAGCAIGPIAGKVGEKVGAKSGEIAEHFTAFAVEAGAATVEGLNDMADNVETASEGDGKWEPNAVDLTRDIIGIAAMADPTGLVQVGVSFMYPLCPDVKGATFPGANSPSDDYGNATECAKEGGVCKCKGGIIKFGAEGKFSSYHIPERRDGTIDCTVDVFGEPIKGIAKSCWCTISNLTKSVQDDSLMDPVDGSTVHATAPARKAYKYAGCFKDDGDRDMKTNKGRVDVAAPIDACFKLCAREFSHSYFSVQDKNECFCDKDYGTPAKKYSKVSDNECPDGKGGPWRNAVYGIIK